MKEYTLEPLADGLQKEKEQECRFIIELFLSNSRKITSPIRWQIYKRL